MHAPLPAKTVVSLYSDTKSTDSGHYFCNERQFALPIGGNKVERLKSGEEAFAQILAAMQSAKHFIWIADWQMAFDVELGRRGEQNHPGRLIEVIRSIIQERPVQVRVLLYGPAIDGAGVKAGLVASRINAINQKSYRGSVIVQGQAPTSSQNDSFEYSHHQKFVVVDGRLSFIGGIDLSYGRHCTPEFDVVIDPSRFVINEMYNPCAKRLRRMAPQEEELVKMGFAEPYGRLLDEGCQPRMPWQDVHIKIEGPASMDIHRNFVRRWNSIVRAKVISKQRGYTFMQAQPSSLSNETVRDPSEIDQAWLEASGSMASLKTAQDQKVGSSTVQIVRSVSSKHLAQESWGMRGFQIPDDVQLLPGNQPSVMGNGIRAWRNEHQANILNAMVNCIRSADNYIYIETQFFVSGFGTAKGVDSTKVGNEDDGIQNTIVLELGKRISQHIAADTNFHVYIVLPAHPEGSIDSGEVWKQQWLALASIQHGDRSLIGSIKAALRANKRNPDDWQRYLTVLNMRNYGVVVQYARDPRTMREDFSREIGRYVVTEQIYIHSKLLIVDDAVAIVGSANVNDRSLTGNGDTEIAAVVVDTEGVELRDLGEPRFKVQTRKFARELRRSLWEKHFGFAINRERYFNSVDRARNAGAKPNPNPDHPPRETTTAGAFTTQSWQTILDKPCDPRTVAAIQRIAAQNARAYEAVFPQVPRNGMKHFDEILQHYTRPYPALAQPSAREITQGFKTARDTLQGMTQQNAGYGIPSDEATAMQRRTEENYRKNIESVPDLAGTNTYGVIPPALSPDYMTSELKPYQQQGLKVPMEDFAKRYVTYKGDQVHNITKAIDYLKANVLGFFVEMPRDWGSNMKVDGGVVKQTTVDIAQNTPKQESDARGAV